MWVLLCVGVCMCGFCNVRVCVCVGFVMCGCVYVWILLCVGVCACGFCNVRVCVCVGFVMCGCFGNMCTCIHCVLYCMPFCIVSFMYIYSQLFCLY